jgi:hypothetical protein
LPIIRESVTWNLSVYTSKVGTKTGTFLETSTSFSFSTWTILGKAISLSSSIKNAYIISIWTFNAGFVLLILLSYTSNASN